MRIILATPEVNLRLAIQLLLSEEPNVQIVGTASNLDGVLALIQTTPVDLVFLDWDLLDQPMNTLVEEFHVEQPEIDLIILVSKASLLSTPLEAGVQAYILKGEPPEKLLQAFRQLVANKKKRIEMGLAARARAKKFDSKNIIEKYVDYYKEVLEGKKS